MIKNHHSRTWRYAEISNRQHDILLLLAAGFSDDQICLRYNIRHTTLNEEIHYLKQAYHADNTRMLITLAYLDNEISLEQVLPLLISLLNAPKVKHIND